MREVLPILNRTKNQNDAITRHLKFFQFFGIMPVNTMSSLFPKISVPFFAVSLIFSTLNILQHTLLTASPQRWGNVGKFTSFVVAGEKVIFCVTPPLMTFLAMKNRLKLGRVVSKLITIKKTFGLLQYRMFGSIVTVSIVAGIVMSSNMTFLTVSCITGNVPWYELTDQLCLNILTITFLAYIFLFTYLAQIVSICLAKMSQSLVEGATSVQRFIRTYNDLVDVADELNAFFDVILSSALIGGLVVVVIAFTSAFFANELTDFWMTWINILWIVLIEVSLVQTLYVCHHAAQQLIILIHIGAKRSLTYKAMGTVTIDYNLGLSITWFKFHRNRSSRLAAVVCAVYCTLVFKWCKKWVNVCSILHTGSRM